LSLLWGGYERITSYGKKAKIRQAQQKIMFAITGVILLILLFSIFGIIAGNTLPIIENAPAGVKYKMPKVNP
jgi:hypothetical protein